VAALLAAGDDLLELRDALVLLGLVESDLRKADRQERALQCRDAEEGAVLVDADGLRQNDDGVIGVLQVGRHLAAVLRDGRDDGAFEIAALVFGGRRPDVDEHGTPLEVRPLGLRERAIDCLTGEKLLPRGEPTSGRRCSGRTSCDRQCDRKRDCSLTRA
jgi:hypothetical protein